VASIESELYGDGGNLTRVMYGSNARHVPAWLYVQQAGPGVASFVGASRVAGGANPLLYGTARTHVFVVGEIIVRPHVAIATDAYRGHGLGGLATSSNDIGEMLRHGELIVGTQQMLDRIRDH